MPVKKKVRFWLARPSVRRFYGTTASLLRLRSLFRGHYWVLYVASSHMYATLAPSHPVELLAPGRPTATRWWRHVLIGVAFGVVIGSSCARLWFWKQYGSSHDVAGSGFSHIIWNACSTSGTGHLCSCLADVLTMFLAVFLLRALLRDGGNGRGCHSFIFYSLPNH